MTNREHKANPVRDLLMPAGIVLLVSGASILLDQRLHTGWLSQTVIILSGLLILTGGLIVRHLGIILAGGLLTSLSAAGFWLFGSLERAWAIRLGGFLALFGVGWLAVFLITALYMRRPWWWMLLPAGLITGLGACFLFSPAGLLDLVLYVGIGLALPMLIWGAFQKMLGLVIPGSLLLSSALGVYAGWSGNGNGSALAHTGIMLVIFGLGWLLITVLSRFVIEKPVWWPLIPGGILVMVGWGLYIGGNPSNALNFVSNTGSIALIMLGLYLLLLRRGIR